MLQKPLSAGQMIETKSSAPIDPLAASAFSGAYDEPKERLRKRLPIPRIEPI